MLLNLDLIIMIIYCNLNIDSNYGDMIIELLEYIIKEIFDYRMVQYYLNQWYQYFPEIPFRYQKH